MPLKGDEKRVDQHIRDLRRLIRELKADTVPNWESRGPIPHSQLDEEIEWFCDVAEEWKGGDL